MATILRVRTTLLLTNGQTGLWTSYWRPGTSGGSTADATDCVARCRAAVESAKAQIHTSTSYIYQTAVDALEDSTGVLTGSFTATAVASTGGTATGDAMPVQTAWLVKHSTALIVAGRRLQGRAYMAGVPEGGNDASGRPSTAGVSAWNAAFTGMLTGGTTLSFPVIWSRPTTSPTLRAGTSGAIIGSQTVTTMWGSQRNRRF